MLLKKNNIRYVWFVTNNIDSYLRLYLFYLHVNIGLLLRSRSTDLKHLQSFYPIDSCCTFYICGSAGNHLPPLPLPPPRVTKGQGQEGVSVKNDKLLELNIYDVNYGISECKKRGLDLNMILQNFLIPGMYKYSHVERNRHLRETVNLQLL